MCAFESTIDGQAFSPADRDPDCACVWFCDSETEEGEGMVFLITGMFCAN
jgi:hypothetical protein